MSEVPIERLESLKTRWSNEYARSHNYYAEIGMRICKEELEKLIEEHKDE